MMTHTDLRNKFSSFWEEKVHKMVPPAPLVLQNDPTTLFTSSGMQPLVNYLLGESHPSGKRLFDIQPCFRAVDIDEVGDNRHTTFFEMMGNWSLGDYFKAEQIPWMWDFFTKVLSLPQDKLYISIFEGGDGVSKDEESYSIWKKLGISDNHVSYYDVHKNWWSRSGSPENMPIGEIGGPDTEVFYDFGPELRLHEKSEFRSQKCHPNCDCGRFLEIGNSVFIQYKKKEDGSLTELSQKNVDYGGGIERILMAVNDEPDAFAIDLFEKIVKAIEEVAKQSYSDTDNKASFRIIADHIKVATFLIKEGILPSNKAHGYVLRRFLRRVAVKMRELNGSFGSNSFSMIARAVLETYGDLYFDVKKDEVLVSNVIDEEIIKFSKTLDRGMKEFEKLQTLNEKTAFNLYQSYGFPFEITQELAESKGAKLDKRLYEEEVLKHQELSRSTSSVMFKGGLADHSDQVIKYHTATHLLHQALRDVLGDSVRQEGSNITEERLRFDFSFDRKPTQEERQKVEDIINEKIKEGIPVHFEILPREKAEKIGALSFFKEKYGDEVKVYFIGGGSDDPGSSYSIEFCGGPHVENTVDIGHITIKKIDKIGANLLRIYAK